MSGCIVKRCICKHEQQDKIHGQGNRVHNANAKGTTYKCTVCGSVTKA